MAGYLGLWVLPRERNCYGFKALDASKIFQAISLLHKSDGSKIGESIILQKEPFVILDWHRHSETSPHKNPSNCSQWNLDFKNKLIMGPLLYYLLAELPGVARDVFKNIS